MKKVGRRSTERVKAEAPFINELLELLPVSDREAMIGRMLRQGEIVMRMHPRTLKWERLVLLAVRGPAETFYAERAMDFLMDQTTVQVRQRWEVAFVGSRRGSRRSIVVKS